MTYTLGESLRQTRFMHADSSQLTGNPLMTMDDQWCGGVLWRLSAYTLGGSYIASLFSVFCIFLLWFWRRMYCNQIRVMYDPENNNSKPICSWEKLSHCNKKSEVFERPLSFVRLTPGVYFSYLRSFFSNCAYLICGLSFHEVFLLFPTRTGESSDCFVTVYKNSPICSMRNETDDK